MFVWEPGRDEPSRKLEYKGVVGWAEFVSDTRLALYLLGDKSSLEVWDVAEGKRIAQVPLSIEPFAPWPDQGGKVVDWYAPWPALGAISAGGRYVALAGADGVALASLDDAREVGTLPIALTQYKDRREYQGMAFRPDGSELLLLTNSEGGKARLRGWSAADGRLVRNLSAEFPMSGPPLIDPESEAVFAPGYPVSGSTALMYPEGGFAAAKLAETPTGRFMAAHFPILRWPDEGPALVLGLIPEAPKGGSPLIPSGKPGESGHLGVLASDSVRAEFREAGTLTEFRLPKRPRPIAADRSGLTAQSPEPPASWAPPPAAEPAPPPSQATTLPAWPSAFGGGQAAVVRYEPKTHELPGTSVRYHEVYWDRHDALKGESSGPPILLWPWAVDPLRKPGGPTPQPAALSSDGQKLALRDPETAGRVDVWDAKGGRLLGLEPYGPTAKVDWIGWGPEGRLLTLGDGKLTAWEIPSGKAIFEVDGGYKAPAELAPGGRWLAVSAGSFVDLLDLADGRCLGRVAAGLENRISDLAVSPDGARLAAVYPPGPYAAERFLEGLELTHLEDTKTPVAVWDLKTGKGEIVTKPVRYFALLHWGAPDLVAVADYETVLYDLRPRGVAGAYAFPAGQPWPKVGLPLHRSPDGRLWVSAPSGPETWSWSARRLPDPGSGEEKAFLAADRTYISASEMTIRVELDAGAEANGKAHGPKLVEELQRRGFKIGPKGWVLRVSHAMADSGDSLTMGRASLPIPKVAYTWDLLDESGHVVWQGKTDGIFPAYSSKYATQAPPAQTTNPFDQSRHFNFGGRDIRGAIVEEIFEVGSGLTIPGILPKSLLKVGDAYPKYPVAVQFRAGKAP